MSDEELRTGTCYVCDEVVMSPRQAPEHQTEPQTTAPTASRSSLGVILACVSISLVICLIIPGGLILYVASRIERVAQKDLEEMPARKAVSTAVAKHRDIPEKKKASDRADSKSASVTKEEKSKSEPGQKESAKHPTKPKEEPKKEEPKIVEAVAKYPEPILVAKNRRLAGIRRVPDGSIKIDGDLSEWKKLAPLEVQAVERGKPTKKPVATPKSQKVWIAYDSRGILIAADIVDTSGTIENVPKGAKGWAFWDNDAIEIFLDTLDLRAPSRGEPNAHQFFAFPLGLPNDNGIGGYESRCLRNAWSIVSHPGAGKDAMLRAGRKTADGWCIEILIPQAALRHGDMKPGQIFGFELQIDTGTNIYYHWANDDPNLRVSTSPFAWGEAIFGGTDAAIELLGADKSPAKALTPGEPLTLRIADADRNANPEKKESIEINVITKSGGRKVLKLEETETNSGIFVGSIATRLNTGKREPSILEIQAGESIVIEYMDPLRANGDRNVVQQLQFSVQP
jgi:hypothetical protein